MDGNAAYLTHRRPSLLQILPRKSWSNCFHKQKTVTWYSIDLPKRSIPTKELINVYRHRSEDGFGRMVTGNVMIEHDHLEAARNPIIPREALFQGEQFDVFWGIAAVEKARQLGRGPAVTSRPSGKFLASGAIV
ncbi:hypothetical protein F4801DRAFT_575079 [Xylaria longipes]|nr:hypothetical protein F4801DRAFT_575079 [Xylaria longipes]